MQGRGREHSSSPGQDSQLPPLAPRDSLTTSSRARPSASTSGRPPRLSHRSRAGCWTCRGRKVKCDEIHPRCGPCTRLNRECDWNHRWNFSDATTSTQGKHTNITTAGNSVWDPQAQRSPSVSPVSRQFDDLPEFAVLTNDEDRERKAEMCRPGTYGVVVTPESFSDLPEYAALASPRGRRTSTQSRGHRISTDSPGSSLSRTSTQTDTNFVVLDRFEDATPPAVAQYRVPSPARRPSIPDALQQLSISSPLHSVAPAYPTAAPTRPGNMEDRFIAHFRRYIVRRLVQPLVDRQPHDNIVPGSTRDVFETEATRFPPLRHAMCAISALNLSYSGQQSLEEALQHYHQALSTAATPDDLISDGVFLRHFLLFIYDICVPMDTDDGGDVMWAQHLNHLRQIAIQRHERLGREPLGYIMWSICELDVYACLMGNGNCEFFRAVMQHNMLPTLEDQLPRLGPSLPSPYSLDEVHVMPPLLRLNQGVLVHTAKLAQIAQQCRTEAAARQAPTSPGTYARWQASVSRAQIELSNFWTQSWPDFLGPEAPQAGYNLPGRARYIFEHAFMLYQTAVIYSRGSMFPGQRLIPTAHQSDIHADTERRCVAILNMASSHLEMHLMELRQVGFSLFMVGVASTQPDAKVQAMNLMTAFQREGGIGQNTYRTRQLLAEVCEEQRAVVSRGGRMEQVDWLTVAKERGLGIVNCGL